MVQDLRRGSEAPVFVVDTGDALLRQAHMNDTQEEVYRLRAGVFRHAHEVMGLDVQAVGELDLALGWPFLGELHATSPVRLLSANLVLRPSGARPFLDRWVVERGGLRVAFVGAMGSYLVLRQDLARDLQVLPEIPAVSRSVQWARREGADLVVLVSHLGLFAERRLLEAVRGIDLVLGGHSRDFLETPVLSAGVPIFQAGTRGKYLGRLDVELDPEGPQGSSAPLGGAVPSGPRKAPHAAAPPDPGEGVRLRYRHHILKLDSSLPSEPGIQAEVDAWHARARRLGVEAPPHPPRTDDPVVENGPGAHPVHLHGTR